DGKIKFDISASKNKGAVQNRKLENGEMKNFGEDLLKNELNVLLTRGVNGLYKTNDARKQLVARNDKNKEIEGKVLQDDRVKHESRDHQLGQSYKDIFPTFFILKPASQQVPNC
ncbi:DUF2075 domain-containing protein, partial [Streptococcus pyogenes]|uniref:DUF2075 domain-containing protein n=1 Tax=Streptococcus pyogenes TaxID=1314 RepID=UPI0021CC77DA